MIVFQKLFDPAQLTASDATYYTTPVNQKCVIKKLVFSNNTNASRTVTVNLVPTGGSVSTTNILIDQKPVGPYSTFEAFEAENQVLNAGDFISAKADSATSVTIMASGLQIAVGAGG